MPAKMDNNVFIDKCNITHKNYFDYSKCEYIHSKSKVIIICPKHGEFLQEPRVHLSGKGCYECGGKTKINQSVFFKKCDIHYKNSDISYNHIKYSCLNDYIYPICSIHGEFKIRCDYFINGHNCQFCSKRKIFNFKDLVKSIHGDYYDYSDTNYINRRTKIKIKCPKHGEFNISPSLHIYGYGCKFCSNENIIIQNKNNFIEKSNKVHNNRYSYEFSDYINSYEKVNIFCTKHGIFKQTPNNHLNGNGCSKCSISKGESEILSFLEENNIKYISQYKFDGCKNINHLLFDFYLPDYNACIEYNGRQHYEVVDYFGGMETLNKQKINDDIKVKYCIDNKIKLLIIKYTDNILNMLVFYKKK